jgi:hypothetical protein
MAAAHRIPSASRWWRLPPSSRGHLFQEVRFFPYFLGIDSGKYCTGSNVHQEGCFACQVWCRYLFQKVRFFLYFLGIDSGKYCTGSNVHQGCFACQVWCRYLFQKVRFFLYFLGIDSGKYCTGSNVHQGCFACQVCFGCTEIMHLQLFR